MTGLRRMAWLLLAVPLAAWLSWGAPAAAAARTIVIQDGAGGPELVPASLTVAPGDTVSFLNNSAYPAGYDVTVTYGGKVEFHEAIGFGSSSAGHWTAPTAGGVRKVIATQPVTGLSAQGSITVAPPPPPPPPPSSPAATTSPRATKVPSKAPSPRTTPSTSPSAPPVAATPFPLPSVSFGPLPSTTVRAPVPGSSPLVAGSPSPTLPARHAVAGGQLEQPTGREHGLPAALAAVFVGGTAAAYVRVLLAEPVDERTGSVGGGR